MAEGLLAVLALYNMVVVIAGVPSARRTFLGCTMSAECVVANAADPPAVATEPLPAGTTLYHLPAGTFVATLDTGFVQALNPSSELCVRRRRGVGIQQTVQQVHSIREVA